MSHRRGTKKAVAAAAAGAVGLAAAVLVVGAQSSVADPISLPLNYHCDLPLVGSQSLKVVINTDLPLSVKTGQPTGTFDIKAVSTINADTVSGLNLIGATTLEGQAIAAATVAAPGLNLPVSVPNDIAKQNIPTSGEMTVNASGKTPSLTFNQPGEAKITVGDLRLKVTPRKADGSVTGITPDGTIDAPCKQDPGQNNTLATIKIGDGGGGTTTPTTPTTPTTTPTTPTTTPTTPTTTTPGGGGIKYAFGIKGQTALKSLGSTAAINGGFDADVDLASKTFTGDLKLDPSSTQFKLFGFVDGRSEIKVEQVGKQTGELVGTGFKAHIKFNVFLPSVQIFGIPISNDPKCGTVSPSTSEMTTGPDFDLLKGGKLTGTYSLSALQNCGSFNDMISMFAKSDGNTLDLNLTKK
ncbi:hypothetical protein NQK81_42765 [Amycolatopsis roodepoortensis]|uniref:DUF6801 domain-containing protein n=1 Tax=Amycolatopsis roodepoortensis TaxID=700274 RepID=A0ABR9L0M1_9PSEU|nr:DUF6801 domain-containing protein [Amycolatopsis roodepoortensis]MBE1574172.1 hypothetical protein [Amycolatopsis roodepoortensis]UUV31396.1 hypothetical protein NQK81_42765 [Amycolatopsis roodepoortensis]